MPKKTLRQKKLSDMRFTYHETGALPSRLNYNPQVTTSVKKATTAQTGAYTSLLTDIKKSLIIGSLFIALEFLITYLLRQ